MKSGLFQLDFVVLMGHTYRSIEFVSSWAGRISCAASRLALWKGSHYASWSHVGIRHSHFQLSMTLIAPPLTHLIESAANVPRHPFIAPNLLGFCRLIGSAFFFFNPFLNLSKLNVSRSLHNAHVTSLFFLFLFLKEWWSSPIGWFYSFVIPTDAAQTLKKRMGGESHRIVEDLRIETTWLE